MKTIKNLLLIAIISILAISCSKEEIKETINQTIQNSSITVGFQIAGQWINLSIGGNGGGYYYPQDAYNSYNAPANGSSYYNSNTNVTVCYIVSKPLDQTKIVVCDFLGRPIASVSLSTGNWQSDNYHFGALQNWNYSRPCAVLVQWDPKWTTGPWSGKIIG